jgi:hypothetical protein
MPNAIIQIGKFIWAATSCGGRLTVGVFPHHYDWHYQNKKIHLEGCETSLAAQFGCITFQPRGYVAWAKWLMFGVKRITH